MKVKKRRWCFMKDDDGHDYLVPADGELPDIFDLLLNEALETDDHSKFIDTFDGYRCASPRSYTFTDPQEK